MLYDAINLSKYIVDKCIKDGNAISNLQLQKILYYIQKDFLQRDELAFPDDIEAWKFGPVVPNVYYHYSGFGAMAISIAKASPIQLDIIDEKYIDAIVEAKRELAPWDLVAETHKKGGAWDVIYKDGAGDHRVIPPELIKAVG